MISVSKTVINNTCEDLLQLYLSLPKDKREQEFPNTARAAKYVGVSRRTIQHWVEVGQIEAVFIGRKCKVHMKSLLAHLQSHAYGKHSNSV